MNLDNLANMLKSEDISDISLAISILKSDQNKILADKNKTGLYNITKSILNYTRVFLSDILKANTDEHDDILKDLTYLNNNVDNFFKASGESVIRLYDEYVVITAKRNADKYKAKYI